MQAARLKATRDRPNKFDAGDCDALSRNSIRCLEENNGDRSAPACQPHFEAYRCRTCDFDLCARCYRRRDKAGFKGMALRKTDQEQSLTTWSYF